MSLKNITCKIIAALVTVYLILGNCAMAGLGIAEAIAEEVTTPGIAVDFEILKYVQYSNGGAKGVEIQTSIEVKETTGQQRHLPANTMELKVQVPEINGIKPERVSLVKSNTKLTNGIENYSVNQNYDKNTGLLVISYENKNNYSEFNPESKDEFEVIYFYPESAYIEKNGQSQISQSVFYKRTFTAHGKTLTLEPEKPRYKSSTMSPTELTNEDIVKEAVEFELKNTADIYKGFMYCNETNKTTYATDYKTMFNLSITNKDVLNGIQIYLNKSKFILKDKELDTNSIHYKYTKISEEDFNKIFGQDGALDFYIGTTKYATIKYADIEGNKKFTTEYYTQTKQNIEGGQVEYPSEVLSVLVKSTKPISEGNVTFEEVKQVIGQSNYGTKVLNIKGIRETRKITAIQLDATTGEETNRNIKEDNINVELKEPSTQISFELSNNKLSTLVTNKLTATIKINDTNSSCKLIDGGNLELKLPDNITNAKVLSAKSLYENGISIKKAKIENGKVILEISGKQTGYDITNISGGTNIVLDIEIDIADSVATHKENINVTYNGMQVSKEIEIISKYGLLMESKIKNETKNSDIITAINENKTIETSLNDTKQIQNIELNIVNNFENDITNVQVLGTLGSSTEENITYDIKLENKISLSKGKVLYSADKNNWQETYTSNARYFKIVLDNNKLLKENSVKAIIKVAIPEKLNYNESSYIKYETSYTNGEESKSLSSIISFITQADNFTEKTRENEVVKKDDNLELTLCPVITQNYVHSGQKLLYAIKVKNISNKTISNIDIQDFIPNEATYIYSEKKKGTGAYYLEEIADSTKRIITWKITSLAPNAEQIIEFMVKVNENISQQQELVNKVNVAYNAQNFDLENKLIIKPSLIIANLTTKDESEVDKYYREGDIIQYCINIKNITNKAVNNAIVKFDIPKNLKFVEGGQAHKNEFGDYIIEKNGVLNNNTFEFNVTKLDSNEEKTIIVKCSTERLSNNYEADISGIVNVILNEDTYQTITKNIKIKQAAYTISLQSSKNEEELLKKNDSIMYTVVVKNIGKTSGEFNIIDEIPKEIQVEKIEYTKDDAEPFSFDTSKQKLEITNYLDQGKTFIFRIYGKVGDVVTNNGEIKTISNFATLVTENYQQKSNNVTVKIKTEKETSDSDTPGMPSNPSNPDTPNTPSNPDDTNTPDAPNKPDNSDTPNVPSDPNNPDTPDVPGNSDKPNEPSDSDNPNAPDTLEDPDTSKKEEYSLSGLAWLDTNKDGKRDDGEQLISGIKVYLVNSETGKIVKDSEEKEISVETAENGEYKFEGIKKGSYLVIFEFDINKYKATKYQVSIAENSSNSDAIISKINIDGNEKTVGATNVLNLKSDLNNIDIGLIEDAKFDLSLEKQISKISVINAQGTKTTEYENINFAKTDLVAKYMNNTSVIVTYKFIIKNIGDVTGYVDVLKDNLPKGLQFSSELNKDWYKGADGAIYTEALSGIAIEPGKTSEIELILTKDTTENSTGTFTNSAELEKTSNIEAIEQAQKDNDKSSADMVISIKTGSPMLYIGITLGSISIITIGAYIVKKKILVE